MSNRMPTLFIGHGSPTNAIEENEFTDGWRRIAKEIQKPDAILCVSAHWYVPYTKVTAMEHPRTIHDFYGFPPALYEQQYPALGAPDLASMISKSSKAISIPLDESWGLDHGTWSVLKQMYPEADIPVVQLSIDYSKPPRYHLDLGQQLNYLREQGVLIIGSGNLVHNLGAVNWQNEDSVYEWAKEFERKIMESLIANDDSVFANFENMRDLAKKAHPSLDHYLPLLYARGAAGNYENLQVFNQKTVYGSISMTSIKFG